MSGIIDRVKWPGRLPFTGITRLLAPRLDFGRLRYYSAIRLPESRLPPLLIRLVGHTRTSVSGVSWFVQEPQGLTGCLDDMVCSASGASDPGSLLAACQNAVRSIAFQHAQTLGRIQQIQNFGLMPFTAERPLPGDSPSLPFCVRFKIRLRREPPYTHPATLDTGRVANAYPGGISTRWSSNHFQSARATDCYAASEFSALAFVGLNNLIAAETENNPRMPAPADQRMMWIRWEKPSAVHV